MGKDNLSCFLCSTRISESILSSEDESPFKTSAVSPLETNLDVVFLLRNLLQVPKNQLESQLKKCGDNPENWITLCSQCTQLTRNARKLQQELKKIEKQLETAQKQVLHLIKTSTLTNYKEEGKYDTKNYTPFQNKIRLYAKKNDYHQLNDNREDRPNFLEDDKQANYLETQKHSTKILVFIEKSFQEAEIKEEVVSPSPPFSPAAEDDDSSTDDHDTIVEPPPPPEEEHVYLCDHCGKNFDTETLLKMHNNELHKVHSFRCSLCGLGFWKTRQLQRHLFSKHKDDPITKKMEEETGLFYRKCKVIGCPALFMKKIEEDRHMAQVHPEGKDDNDGKTYKCRICGRGFWSRFQCWRHERIHEVKGKVRNINKKIWRSSAEEFKITQDKPSCLDKRFKCGECGKSWDKVRNWGEHVWRKHEGGRDIPCPEDKCGMVFKAGGGGGTGGLDEFQSHWNMAHKVKRRKRSYKCLVEGVFVCKVCGEDKGSWKRLWYHRKIEHREGNGVEEKVGVTCEICGKGLKNKEYLSTHVKHVHEKKFKFRCEVCGLGMWRRIELEKHLLVKHKGEEAARRLGKEGVELRRCEVEGCGFTYLREGQLGKHKEKWHVGGNWKAKVENKCKVCGMGFRRKDHLKLHELKIHNSDFN